LEGSDLLVAELERSLNVTRAEIEKRIDELYQVPPKEFTRARSKLASELAAEGERARGSIVRDLPKPSSSAWAVNQLWFNEQPTFAALLETGKRLRAAQQGVLAGRGAQAMQKAMADERRALSALVDKARELLSRAGLGASPATLERTKTSLQAIARSPDPQFAGRLAHDLELPGLVALVGSSTPDEDERTEPAAQRPAKPKARVAEPRKAKARPKDSGQGQAAAATKAALARNRERAKNALKEASNALKLADGRHRQAEKQELAQKRIVERIDAELERLDAERRRLEAERARAKRAADAAERETSRLNQDLEAAAVALEEAKAQDAGARGVKR